MAALVPVARRESANGEGAGSGADQWGGSARLLVDFLPAFWLLWVRHQSRWFPDGAFCFHAALCDGRVALRGGGLSMGGRPGEDVNLQPRLILSRKGLDDLFLMIILPTREEET